MKHSDPVGILPSLPMGLVQQLQRWHWGANFPVLMTLGSLGMAAGVFLFHAPWTFVFVLPALLAYQAEQQQPTVQGKLWVRAEVLMLVNSLLLLGLMADLLATGVQTFSVQPLLGAVELMLSLIFVVPMVFLWKFTWRALQK